MNTKDDQRQPKVGTSGLVCDEEPQIIRCGTLLCGRPADWRKPKTWGGYETGEWHRKCQRCFDAARENADGWSRVLQPSHNDALSESQARKETL